MPSYSDQQHGDYKEALQPITQSSTSQSTKILKELVSFFHLPKRSHWDCIGPACLGGGECSLG